MRLITSPVRAASSWTRAFATALLLLCVSLLAGVAPASTVPQTGGTLRVQIAERVTSVDPRKWTTDGRDDAGMEKIDTLIFDRLTQFDDNGMMRPALAISWEYDAPAKRWEFRLRDGVQFSDGTPFTPVEAALALQQLLGNAFDVSATSDSVAIQSDHDIKDLPAVLATGRYFIFRAAADGSVSGTGPFRVSEWPSGPTAGKDLSAKAILIASESCWAGRPFVDRLEITMGVGSQQVVTAIAFGQADIVELPAGQVRAEMQRGVRSQSSEAVDLLALQFDTSWPSVKDPLVRGAIARALDRASIADAILQKQAVPAGGLLPNWISGYAHLFSTTFDSAAAMKTLSTTQQKVSRAAPLTLVYDSEDADSGAVAERVAVNLRAVGINVQVIAASPASGANPPAEMRLVRIHVAAPNSSIALANVLSALGEPAGNLDSPEQQFADERAPIDAFRVIPLVHVSETVGLGLEVRDWMPTRWGTWRLQDVWLAPSDAARAATK